MKKFFLLVFATMLAVNVSAQNWQKNIVGIRGGVNMSKIDYFIDLFTRQPSFNAGISYEHLLFDTAPLYFESGLQLSDKGFKSDLLEATAHAFYLEAPIMFNYKVRITDDITIYPSVGLYTAFGLFGNLEEVLYNEETDRDEIERTPMFDKDGFGYNRFDFGYRGGLSATWKNYVITIGYEHGLIDMIHDDDEEDDWGMAATSNNLFVTLGFNF